MKRRIRVIVGCLLTGALGFWTLPSDAQVQCPKIEPMHTLVLKATYKDAKNSIQDEGNEAANARTLAPLTLFFETLNRAVDAPDASPRNPETNCAFQLYNQWATAGALTYEPEVYDSGGKVTRGLRSSAFQILGLKFRSAGYSLSSTVLMWLQKMDRQNVEF